MPIEYKFCFMYKKHFVEQKKFHLFYSVFKKIIPDATTPTFKEVGGGNSTPHILSKEIDNFKSKSSRLS